MDPDMEEIDAGGTSGASRPGIPGFEVDLPVGSRLPGDRPRTAEHLGLGCCFHRRRSGDEDEPGMISALAATLSPVRFEHHAEAGDGGIFSDGARTHTRVVDGGLHLPEPPGIRRRRGLRPAPCRIDWGESPVDWKPSVCWQLPIKVDWEAGVGGHRGGDGAPLDSP